MAGLARPTLRCLREDLALAVPRADTPLEEISHPLLAKATERFADDQTPHERIAAIDDEVLFKVKAQRWQGAIWVDAGIPWLVAAGWREEGSLDDCVVCDEFDLECECSVYMPPRTASLIHAMAETYCDTIHDLAEAIPSAIPLRPHHDLWPIPEAAWWQSRDFYRKFARAFEDIARDIENGQEPDPHNMAEEIALHLVLDAAAGIVADEMPELELFTGGMPRSHFDFDFDLLHDVLYQGKDYAVAYLGNRSIAKPGDLEEWFEDFQTPAPRDPERGFRR